jgi:hypothetical protein
MIEINVSGGLGVRLFQYAFGYILSTLKNDSLKILESDNYKQNYESATKRKYSKFEKLTQIFPNIKLQIQNKNNFQTNPKIISGHTHNIEELIKYNGKIIMKGSGFQNYNFYKNHKKLIKNLLYIPEEKLKKFNSNDVVIHYRLGDAKTELLKKKIRHNEKYIGYHNYPNMSNDYFIDILSKNNFDKVYVVTDSPNDIYIQTLKSKISCEIVSTNMYDDFLFLVSAPNLIICHSTFSWWAAFLSNAKKIYMPKTNFNKNIKYHAEWIYRNDIFLNVEDDNRYTYV